MKVRYAPAPILIAAVGLVAAALAGDEAPRHKGDRADRRELAPDMWAGRVTGDTVREEMLTRSRNEVAKAASLLEAAEELRQGGHPDEAVGMLQRVVALALPAGRESDKLVATAYRALGEIYADPAMAPAKALVFYGSAIARMDVLQDNLLIVETLDRVIALQGALGDRDAVAATESMRLDVQLGIAPVEIAFGPAVPGPAPRDAGDETCDVAVPVTLPHSETMSISFWFDENWRDFTVTEPRIVVVETLDADTTKDTRLGLFTNCDATLVATDDDGGPGLLSRIQSGCLAPGHYWVKAHGFDTATPQDFTLRITSIACLGPDGYESDDEPASANPIGFRNNGNGEGHQRGRDNRQIQHHSIYPRSDNDWMKFGLSRTNWISVETFGVLGGNPDTIMGVITSGGKLLAVNDDKAPGDLASKLEFCLPAGDYFTAVLPFSGLEEYYYDVAVDVQGSCRLETEPNGDCELANDLPAGEVWNGLHQPFGLTSEDDWWRIVVPERQMVTIATDGFDDFDVDTLLGLYDGCPGNLLAFDDDGGPGFKSLIEIALDPGTYWVRVRQSPFGVPGAAFPYQILVTFSAPPPPAPRETEPNNDCAHANPVELGDTVLGSIGVVGDKDFFLLHVPAGSLVDIETLGPSGDTVLDISAASGNPQIGCDDDSGVGLFSRWSCCLPAGTYCVGVKDYFSDEAIPNYSIDFRYLGGCDPSTPLQCSISASPQCPHPF